MDSEGREITREAPVQTAVGYPVVERRDAVIRAFKDDVLSHLGQPMVDVRSPGEFSGELLHMPDYPQEGAMRGGWFVLTHLLGLANVRTYDGSWTEWGNAVGVPIEVGAR